MCEQETHSIFSLPVHASHVLSNTCSEPHPLGVGLGLKNQTMPSKLWTRNWTIPCSSCDPNFPNLTWNLDGSPFLFIMTFNLSCKVQNVIFQHKSKEEAVNHVFQCMTSLQFTHLGMSDGLAGQPRPAPHDGKSLSRHGHGGGWSRPPHFFPLFFSYQYFKTKLEYKHQ